MADMKRAFVCGHPISHSRSPLIHNNWIEKHGLNGSYERIDIAPENFEGFLKELSANGFAGGNITLPHKETAHAILDKKDDAAKAIGAVNTLWFEGADLWGGNTDAYGFAANLDDQIGGWREVERAMVFGAGGASRAVLHALTLAGVKHIDLINRTVSRAENLAEQFGNHVKPHGWSKVDDLMKTADLFINTTSLGMDDDAPFPVDFSKSKPTAMAADIVYIPLQTPFLKAAKMHGLKTSDGLGMLLHQAVPGFEKWFGVHPTVDENLRQIILDDINTGQDQ